MSNGASTCSQENEVRKRWKGGGYLEVANRYFFELKEGDSTRCVPVREPLSLKVRDGSLRESR